MKVAVTGASGFVGKRLVLSLRRLNHHILVLSRGQRRISDGVQAVIGDLASPHARFDELVAGCDVIFHCAGELRDTTLMRPLHVDGTRRLLDAALDRSAKSGTPLHWVQLSSVGAYGPPGSATQERVVTEESPKNPVGEYEITKTEADEFIIEVDSTLFSYSIVRPSNVIAADMPNASVRALGSMVRRGLFFYLGPPGAIATYVHVDDVIETLLRCAFDPRARGQVFNVSNDCSFELMIERIAAAVGVRPPRLRLPESFVRVATRLAGSLVRFPLTPQRIDALVMRTRYPAVKLAQRLGFVPRASIPDVIGDVVLGRDIQFKV
jgi:nucleoside-diphosphate-sugar epimerase